MKICGACERELLEDSFSEEQRRLRQSIRRCEECIIAGNQLVLMKKGRTKSEEDDCPICQLPMPLLDQCHSTFRPCCMKKVCSGCLFASVKRGMRDCPFCRTSVSNDSQFLAMIRKRVDKGDPLAMYYVGRQYQLGLLGLEKDVTRAVELYERAAELGVKEAHFNLGSLYDVYDVGTDVEKDTAKAFRHYEAAAMCCHVFARSNLGYLEYKAGNVDLALQHWMISATLGCEKSLKGVKILLKRGLANRADYAESLRGYQNAVEEMSSPDRDEAKVRLGV